MLIGRNVPQDAGDLGFSDADTPANWQFLIDIIPAQLAAKNWRAFLEFDSDTFRYCSFIVKDEYGCCLKSLAHPARGKLKRRTGEPGRAKSKVQKGKS